MRRPQPPTYLLAALVAEVVLHALLPGPRLLSGAWRSIGAVPLALGAWLNLWAEGLFKRAGTAVQPFQESAELVCSGPYRFSRHPMYLGMVAITLGAALLAGSLVTLATPVALGWALDRHFAQPEEREMLRQFGSRYQAYCRVVGRWLGRRS